MAKSIALLTLAALLTQGIPALAQIPSPSPQPTPDFSPSTKTTIPGLLDPLELPFPLVDPILPPGSSRPNPPKPQGPFILSDRLNDLRTANTSLRYAIIKDLSDPKRNIIPALITALKTESDPLLKSALAEVLATRWEEATPAIDSLVAMLSDKRRALVPSDDYPRPAEPTLALTPLPYYGTIPSAPVKRTPSDSPGNPTNLLRISAIETLGKIGLPSREKATRSLTALLKDENPLVQVNAVWALLEIGADVPVLDTWLSLLQGGDADSRQAAARLAQGNGSLLRKAFGSEATPKTISLLVAALGAPENNVRNAARNGLKLFGAEVVPDLTKALNSPNPLLRLTAAKILGKQQGKASLATPALINLLGDNGEYNPPPSPYTLSFDYISYDPEDYYDDYWTGKPSSSDRFVRINAAIALGSIRSTEAIPALQLGLKDPNPEMQLACVWALTRLGQTETVLPIIDTLIKNPNQSIQFTSLRILKAIGTPGAKYLLPILLKQFDEAKPENRENVVLGFLDFGIVALPALSRLRETLEGPDKNARGYAVTILANIYEDLDRKQKKGELSKDDRRQALKELEKILKIVTKPDAKFNKAPVDRLRLVQTKL
jgi:HEAT repeat protein